MWTIISDPWFYATAVPAVLIAGISKGGFGGGMGSMAVPMMALTISPVQAAAIMLPILCTIDIFTVWTWRRHWDMSNMRILLPAAIIGLGLGWAGFRYMDDDAVRLLIGTIAVVFAADYFLPLRSKGGPSVPNRVLGSFWGMVAGFTSFVAHAGGPPIAVYLLPQRLDIRLYTGTAAVFFIAVNYLKLVPYGLLGQLDATNLGTAAVLMTLAPVGVWIGVRLQRRVSNDLFYRLCYGFLALAGVKLLADGLGFA